MSDIFISYSNEDRGRAEELARSLETKGWTVWWDRQVPFGKSFDQVIEAEISAARCVLVLWTAASVGSEWVKNEAREGRSRGVLIPIRLEELRPPLEFRDIQTANLVGWQAGIPNPEFDKLVEQLRTLVEASPARVSPPHTPSVGVSKERAAPLAPPRVGRRWGAVVALVVAALVAIGGGFSSLWQTYSAKPRVPDVVKMATRDAWKHIQAAGFAVGQEQPLETADAAPGTVLSQSPRAGDRVPRGARVDLHVAAVPRVEVPDVRGMLALRAKEVLEQRGLSVGRIEYAPSGTQRAGEVTQQDPQAGTRIEKGGAAGVNLLVAKAPLLPVPDLRGTTAQRAKELLEHEGIAVGKIEYVPSSTKQPGIVLEQDPPPGTRIERGEAINLQLASKPLSPQGGQPSKPPAKPVAPDPELQFRLAREAGQRGDYVESARLARIAADLGNLNAQNMLAQYYWKGAPGVERDSAQATNWALKAAKGGSAAAQYFLARRYEQGDLPELGKNSASARYWLQKSAEAGYEPAKQLLAQQEPPFKPASPDPEQLYRLAREAGQRRDYAESARLARMAADQGNVNAQSLLAEYYWKGAVGVERDSAQATNWALKAAKGGSPAAQYFLARRYEQGDLPELGRNSASAQYWLQKSAEGGYGPAKELLAQQASTRQPQATQQAQYRRVDWGYDGCDVKFGELLTNMTEEEMIRRASAANADGFTFHPALKYGHLMIGAYPQGCRSASNLSWPLYLRQ